MSDVTELAGFLGLLRFKLVVVLDVFARMPLAFRVFHSEPTAMQVSALVRYAAQRFGPPKHFVSDQVSQLTSDCLADVLRRLGVHHRFGAIGCTGSIAVIERFWKTLKERLAQYATRPPIKNELERRLRLQLLFYAWFPPHQVLHGGTPGEIYFGVKRMEIVSGGAPRAVAERDAAEPPFSIGFLDREERLPVLLPRAA